MSFNNIQSILIIGASGRTGLACLRELANHDSKPSVHAFCRSPSKLSDEDKALCASVITGNARVAQDLERALKLSKATMVVVSIGDGDSVAKSDIRQASAEALAAVLRKPEFKKVKTLIVSSTGAGTSKIVVGFGFGMLISFHLRHILKDHTKQEAAFSNLTKRTTIVRATALTDDQPTGKMVEFGDKEKSPTLKTDRQDLAEWVTAQICDSGSFGNEVVNITSVEK